ncbi:MAG: hypothetical protein C3F18_09845 [Nitrosomonadales bacterium]|nr:MAG: hypothetical protein C3F18_09845 [Nitrosomonadales bacterium]
MALFDNALAEMGYSSILEPRPFITYAKQAGFATVKTADAISVQSLRDLAPELRNAGVMVFRLGIKPGTKGTSFGLAKHTGSWDDYFLQDKNVFAGCKPTPVKGKREGLRIFDILPRSTETSLVNLAVASGILTTALQIESKSDEIVNATAQGTYSFTVRPHKDINEACWHHNFGQVEIDGAFVAKRDGVETVFVVEAKVSTDFESLAKHKIAYPMLAIETSLAQGTPVVGVYLRVLRRPSGFGFFVTECCFSNDQHEIASLIAVRAGAYLYEPVA